jgi:hypothetical protein
MPKVKYITSPDELPAGQNYVLVMYGKEYAQMRHPLGLTITVARQDSKTISELSFKRVFRIFLLTNSSGATTSSA